MTHHHARLDPSVFQAYMNPGWKIPAHVKLMARTIRDAIEKGDGRVIVTMPPRHSKSNLISIHTPAWFLDIWPERAVMLASYSADIASDWGRKVRNLILENPAKFLVSLSPDSKASDKWNTPEGGGMVCTGVHGGQTGRPADLLIVDDPIKNEEEASSETIREKVWEWYQSCVETRIEPKGSIVLVQTRWNEDDLAGRLQAHQKEAEEEGRPHIPWTIINFPCIAEEEDVLGRKPGEPLWPERGFDLEWAARKQTAVGSRVWSALYQQRPSPLGGAVFKREHFRYFTRRGDHVFLHRPGMEPKAWIISEFRWIQTVDTAAKIKTLNDWTACLTCGVTKDREMLIFDVSRARLEVPDQLPFLDRMWDKYPLVAWQGIEDKGSGMGLLQSAARLGRPRRPLKATVDKITRSETAAIWYQNEKVYHPRDASWLDDFEGELLSFPNGRFDDQVDCLAYAAMEMGQANAFMVTESVLRQMRTHDLGDEGERFREDADNPDHGEWVRDREMSGIMPEGNPFG